MSRKPNPIQTEINAFGQKWTKLGESMVTEIQRRIGKGESAEDAVRAVFRKHKVPNRVRSWVMDGVVAGVEIGAGAGIVADGVGFRRWYLDQHWDGADLTLSQTINRQEYRAVAIQEIRRGLRQAKSWQSLAKSINATKLTKADIAGDVWELVKQSRKMFAGDKEAALKYERQVRAVQKRVERLAANGAPTQRLKKAYQAIIDATQTGSKDALNKAIGRAVNAKARYNAERIARTEIARGYGEGFQVRQFADSDIIGYRWDLSSRHPVPDVCDVHASADHYGMGPGTYPKGTGPFYPAHPGCTCNLSDVYKGELEVSERQDRRAGARYLLDHPQVAKAALGEKRYKQLKKHPGQWQKLLPNWRGHEDKAAAIPDRFIKEG